MGFFELIWPIFFPLCGAIISVAHIRLKQYTDAQALGCFLMWQLAVGLGIGLLYGGLGHLFFADKVAASIGWPVGNPFQREVGIWDTVMGLTAILCLKYGEDFWRAVIIGPGLFLVAAGAGHVWELMAHGNTSVNNAGAVMYFDLLYPLFLAALFLLYQREKKKTPQ